MEKEKSGKFRVVISKEANEKLEMEVEKILKECDSVKLSKSDLAEYVFLNLQKLLSDADMKKIINLHFDDSKVIKKIAKEIEGKQLDLETRKVLREYYVKHLAQNENERLHKSV